MGIENQYKAKTEPDYFLIRFLGLSGLGALRMMLHWASWGKEYELVKALDIQLPDHRRYTLHNENFQSLNQLGIRQSPEGIQLTDDQGQDFVDTPLIPYSAFQG